MRAGRRRRELAHEVLGFLRRQAEGARYITSVCTGSLVLAATGLLAGRRATTHWASHDFLVRLGAIAVRARVVADGKFVTGGGVTAGIDMALRVVGDLLSRETAEAGQLNLEYAPAPPFASGQPETAPSEVVTLVRERGRANRASARQNPARAPKIARKLNVGRRASTITPSANRPFGISRLASPKSTFLLIVGASDHT